MCADVLSTNRWDLTIKLVKVSFVFTSGLGLCVNKFLFFVRKTCPHNILTFFSALLKTQIVGTR